MGESHHTPGSIITPRPQDQGIPAQLTPPPPTPGVVLAAHRGASSAAFNSKRQNPRPQCPADARRAYERAGAYELAGAPPGVLVAQAGVLDF